ncbi:unnamed protein product [Protopolystoma xenopodis]|uniref:Uncharacterized protein n=1 Tax=Protopolystoma xenopodis TaxID=117903 RepID=A0A3S5AUB7_9PLAT|nr:unnamed protein product [Protopolystoma xenopodis]
MSSIVLSRRTWNPLHLVGCVYANRVDNQAESASKGASLTPPIAQGNLRSGAVRHNLIAVLPRSGYCLFTVARSPQMIFESLARLIEFYVKMPW